MPAEPLRVGDREKIFLSGIVLAAGASARMGRPKQMLPYGDSTLTGTVTRCLLQAGVDGVVVVTRAALVGALDLPDDVRIRVALNEVTDSEIQTFGITRSHQ